MDIDKAFKDTCRVLFKKEVGGIDDFEEYLKTYTEEVKAARSVTGKEVYFTAPYATGARFVSYKDYENQNRQARNGARNSETATKPINKEIDKPIDFDDIKDIDSLASSLYERFCYSGDKVLGNSSFVEQSENVIDSTVIYRSSEILRCEYVAYSSLMRDSKYMFGSSCLGTSSFCVNVCESNFSQRCFECNIIFYSSDAYYCNDCKGCHDIMFSFDQDSKNHMIGNNQLEKSAYLRIKDHLIEQMGQELEGNKRLPTMIELLMGGS